MKAHPELHSEVINIIKSYVPNNADVIDIGAGEGRNSIFLAKQGFKVLAIDKIPEGLKKLKRYATLHNLDNIITKVVDIKNFRFQPNKYSLIIAIAVLDFFKKSEIESLAEKIKKALIKNGIIYLKVFSIKDPFLNKIKKINLEPIEENTFYLPKARIYRHFFTKEELKKMFSEFEIIQLKERKIRDYSHGQPHFHQVITFVAKNKK